MLQFTKFNPVRDLGEVVPGLSVCLSEAIETGVVKDLGVSADFNGLDEVERVGSRVSDAFEAFEALHGVQNDTTGAFVQALESQGLNPVKE